MQTGKNTLSIVRLDLETEKAAEQFFEAHVHAATSVSYNNGSSSLAATDLQQAVDELDGIVTATDFIKVSCDNNASNTTITGLVFNKANIKAARCEVDVERRTDTASEQKNETGTLYISHNTEDDLWEISFVSHGNDPVKNDSETAFAISVAGQVDYSTSNFAGASYAGFIRVRNIQTIEQ